MPISHATAASVAAAYTAFFTGLDLDKCGVMNSVFAI